jgi:hypothetical protein
VRKRRLTVVCVRGRFFSKIQFPGRDEVADILRASQMHMAKSRQQEDAARKAVAFALRGSESREVEELPSTEVAPVITIPTGVPVMAHTVGTAEDGRPLSRCRNRYQRAFPPLD